MLNEKRQEIIEKLRSILGYKVKSKEETETDEKSIEKIVSKHLGDLVRKYKAEELSYLIESLSEWMITLEFSPRKTSLEILTDTLEKKYGHEHTRKQTFEQFIEEVFANYTQKPRDLIEYLIGKHEQKTERRKAK